MKDNLAEIVLITDISGSMYPLHSDTIGGINSFISEQQKEPGEAYFTLVTFNNVYHTVIESKNLADVKLLKNDAFVENGCTALYDAVGATIDNLGKRLAALDENQRPSVVIIAILTDGHENASLTYTQEQVAEKIKHQRENYNWKFMFLAANQDAWAGANMLNMDTNLSFTYSPDTVGMATAYGVTSSAASALRANKSVDISNKLN